MIMVRTAVIFRTHFWDEFCDRQLGRLRDVSAGLDIFILVDETNGPVVVRANEPVVRVTEDGLLGLGLARAGEGALLWFNGDYPLYGFAAEHPDYDYYLQLEYDVVINRPLAKLMAEVAERNLDYVGLTKHDPAVTWFWRKTMLGVYPSSVVKNQLICFSVFSAAALRHLFATRREQSVAWQAGALGSWPFCEGFIPTELQQAGFASAELSVFGHVNAYDHWPPYVEADIGSLGGEDFIHPVLDAQRFVASMQKYHVGLLGFLNPNSQFHRKLRRLPPGSYLLALLESFSAKVRRNLVQGIGRLLPARLVNQEGGR